MSYNLISFYEKKAKEYTDKYNLDVNSKHPGWNDSEDAFRHAFMQASYALKHNDNFAEFVADSYENIVGTIQEQSKQGKNIPPRYYIKEKYLI